ncbi:PREDICTED: uncharacterized protein LOC109146657 [Ipomoea nil]|uniref:uncharacterized protein LOC109146657 n=1 Tax=Ipomoea nil TaxID=35883 RepID=UPI0009008C3C|nr:PREDICTED: uncharacterized protein LOC109146657 [Ipomoea nil]
MTTMLRTSPVGDLIVAAAKLWVIWNARNELVWKNETPVLESMRMHVQTLVSSWEQLRNEVTPGTSATGMRTSAWEPPPIGFLKCNVDAATFDNGAGFGAVVRDSNGKYIAACSARLECGNDPLMAESMAVKEALTSMKSHHFNNIMLESDCLNFCSVFNSRTLNSSYVGLVIKQCCKIATDIGNVSVRHVNRSANHAAHVLARASASLSGFGSWFGVPPPCLSLLIDY